jgi:hypothetical protein
MGRRDVRALPRQDYHTVSIKQVGQVDSESGSGAVLYDRIILKDVFACPGTPLSRFVCVRSEHNSK